MTDLIFAKNDNVVFDNPTDIYKCSCKDCGFVINISEATKECPRCDKQLFEKMTRASFKSLFKECLVAFKVPEKDINLFMKDGVCLSEINICNQMSIIMDINFHIRFGKAFKSFLATESLSKIITFNFVDNEYL